MSLPTLTVALQDVDRAVAGAGVFVLQLLDKLKMAKETAPAVAMPTEIGQSSSPAGVISFVDLPIDLLRKIWEHLDVDTLAGVVPLVCKAWRDEVARPALWQDRLTPKMVEQLSQLASAGAPVSAAHLYLALCGRNFVRNPTFRRDCNSPSLLEFGRLSWNKWKRDAWVVGHTTKDGVCWEEQADGIDAAAGPPPNPLPYAGSGSRGIGERVQQQLRGLLGGLAAPKEDPPEMSTGPAAPPVPPSCITTTADWCEVMQVIDLQGELVSRGLSGAQAAQLLDAGLGMRLSVHVGSRRDCLGQFCVGLMLDEGSSTGELPQMQSFVSRPSRHAFFSGRLRCEARGAWQRFEYRLAACPRGCRRALVLLRGRRAGGEPAAPEPVPVFCGAKFTCAELVFEAER
ncbi:hypothetical protein Agub_g4658 [Astrephomene gubernaculifera]|uniref:F-box domain-containing protein n=1 Tax=Astrephomene gubernaculifera TaxID=47775 RepID=A0AAD3HJF2_9CHLO|nr:hypothetical protein Agub_g4658 [Astrephomene gubernaculifera]